MRTSNMIVLVWKHLRRRLLLRSITMAAVCKEDVEYQVERLDYYTQTFPLGLMNGSLLHPSTTQLQFYHVDRV